MWPSGALNSRGPQCVDMFACIIYQKKVLSMWVWTSWAILQHAKCCIFKRDNSCKAEAGTIKIVKLPFLKKSINFHTPLIEIWFLNVQQYCRLLSTDTGKPCTALQSYQAGHTFFPLKYWYAALQCIYNVVMFKTLGVCISHCEN